MPARSVASLSAYVGRRRSALRRAGSAAARRVTPSSQRCTRTNSVHALIDSELGSFSEKELPVAARAPFVLCLPAAPSPARRPLRVHSDDDLRDDDRTADDQRRSPPRSSRFAEGPTSPEGHRHEGDRQREVRYSFTVRELPTQRSGTHDHRAYFDAPPKIELRQLPADAPLRGCRHAADTLPRCRLPNGADQEALRCARPAGFRRRKEWEVSKRSSELLVVDVPV